MYLSQDFKHALTSCWYRLSRVNGKLVTLNVGIKAYEAYLRKKVCITIRTYINYNDSNA